MQATPDPALGSRLPTVLVATLPALTAVALLYLGRRSRADPVRFAAAGGAGYAVALLTVWAGTRVLFWRFAAEFPESLPFVFPVVVGVGALFVGQWSVATLLFVSYRLRTAALWLFGVTWFTIYGFLFVGGEGSATFLLLVWLFGIGPMTFAPLLLLAGAEVAVRKWGAIGSVVDRGLE
jgi:hypothetical protein